MDNKLRQGRSQARLQKEEGGHTTEVTRTGKPGKIGVKPMEIESKSTANVTASGATDAPVLGTQDAGEKWITGQRKKIVTPKLEIKVAAWNVRTGHHVGQKEIIARELLKCKISIATLSELRMTGSGTMTI